VSRTRIPDVGAVARLTRVARRAVVTPDDRSPDTSTQRSPSLTSMAYAAGGPMLSPSSMKYNTTDSTGRSMPKSTWNQSSALVDPTVVHRFGGDA
jgi:hypothetical protein